MQSLMLLDQAWDMLSRFIAVTTPVSFQPRPRADPSSVPNSGSYAGLLCALVCSTGLVTFSVGVRLPQSTRGWTISTGVRLPQSTKGWTISVGVRLSQGTTGWAVYKQLKVL